jgi:RNA polymerase sigma-70 factor (ECF subfamily)
MSGRSSDDTPGRPPVDGPPDVRRAIEAVWRIEAPRVIARLTRLVGDVGVAEDLAQDTFVAALRRWSRSGVPDNPGAWLTTTARYLAIDLIRRRDARDRKHAELGAPPDAVDVDFDGAVEGVGDDLLGLMFMTCHPVLSPDARVALTLRLLGGLTTAEIARAFLVPEATVAQRIVRAKRTLTAARVPFEVPAPAERADRLASVLEVVYLVFNEGYAATSGDELVRADLCREAMRLGRVLAALVPDEPEAHGLVALMELQGSRMHARTGPDGEAVVLDDQDRSQWDRLLISHGLGALAQVERLGGTLGPYALQAAIAACHARARVAKDTDWGRIAALYDALSQVAPSPVVEVNRAVALARAFGPEAGLALADELAEVPELRSYYPLPSVRGDLLARLGRLAEARDEFLRAASLTGNARERAVLLGRAASCEAGVPGTPEGP